MKQILKDGVVIVNGSDISDHVREVSVESERDEVDVTGLQANNKETLAGLGDGTITLDVFQDFEAGEIDSIMEPLSHSDVPFTVQVRPHLGAIAANNPEYRMDTLLFTYNPIAGAVGEALTTPLTFRNATQAGLVRDITP
jgi:hypothetical protein